MPLVSAGAVIMALYAAINSPRLLLFFLVVAAGYLIFRRHVWIPVIASIPALALGDVITIALSKDSAYTFSLGELLLYLSFGIWCLNFLFLRDRFPRKIRFGLPFAFLSAYILVALPFVVSVANTHWYFGQLRIIAISLIAYFIARNTIDTSRKIRWLYGSLGLFILLLAAQAFWYIATHGLSGDLLYDRNRVLLPVGAAAFASALLSFLIPIVGLFGRYTSDYRERTVIFALTLAGFVALFLLMSKAAIGAFCIGLLFAVSKLRRDRLKTLMTVGVVTVVLTLVFLPFASSFITRIVSATQDMSNQYRLEEYRMIWFAARDTVLFGLGPGQHIVFYQRFLYPDFTNLLNNYFLQAFADLGLVGFALISGLAYSIVRLARKALRMTGKRALLGVGIASAFLIASINGLAEVTFFGLPYALTFWTVVGATENMVNSSDEIS